MFKPLTKEQYDSAIQSGFTHDQIIANEKIRKSQNAEQPVGYFSRLGQSYSKAGQDIISGIQEGAQDIQKGSMLGGIRAGLRTVGGVASATFSPITEAPIVKPALEGVGNLISEIPGIDTVVKKLNELVTKYPQVAKDIQNVIDIATIGVGSGAQKPIGVALEKTGVALEKSGVTAAKIAKNNFAQELVRPIETKTVKLEQVGRTTEAGGLFKKDIITPTSSELESAKQVSQIPGISSNNTFQKNFNLVRDYNVNQAKQLESDIIKYDFIIPKKEVISKLDAVAKTLTTENPLIVGDAEKTANRLIAGAKKIIQENEGKGSGLLKARKQYDKWVLTQKPKAFDANSENAFTIANRAIRDTLNTTLDENAVNLGVKDSLQRQSSLYNAMENIAPKAAAEANTPILRAFERVGKVIGVKNRLVQAVATAVGIGGLGAAATFAPAVATLGGVGFIIYKAGKLVMKPETRIALGKLLQTSGNLINPADRKILEEALNIYKE